MIGLWRLGFGLNKGRAALKEFLPQIAQIVFADQTQIPLRLCSLRSERVHHGLFRLNADSFTALLAALIYRPGRLCTNYSPAQLATLGVFYNEC